MSTYCLRSGCDTSIIHPEPLRNVVETAVRDQYSRALCDNTLACLFLLSQHRDSIAPENTVQLELEQIAYLPL
jgi:hypothetical protein